MAKDFRKKTFHKVLRGYSPDEVDAYLSCINDEFRKLERKNSDNERKLSIALQKLDEINLEKSRYEDTPEVTEAEKTADSIVKKANADAEAIRAGASQAAEEALREAAEEAANEAEKIIAEAEAYSARVRSAADGLSKTAGDMYEEIVSFRDSLFELYNSHIESIEKMANAAEDFSDKVDGMYQPDDGETSTEGDTTDAGDESVAAEPDEVAESVDEIETDAETAPKAAQDLYIDLEDEYADGVDDEYINDALGLGGEEEFLTDEPEESEPENTEADSVISEVDEVRRRQLDKFFGILNDDELLGAEDDDSADDTQAHESDFNDAETRVLDIGGLLREGRRIKEKSDLQPEDDFNYEKSDGGYVEMDSIFDGKDERELSLTDEFDIVYSDKNARKSVDEIRRQPIVAPSAPQKKSGKWHIKK